MIKRSVKIPTLEVRYGSFATDAFSASVTLCR
jgi:hypothetical protein